MRLLCLVLLPLCVFGYGNRVQKQLIVLSAPSVWDVHYRDHFYDLIDFQINFAKMVLGHDDVIVIADKHTMPFLDGRAHKIRAKLPTESLIQANIYDIYMREFAPFGLRQMIKFHYRPRNMDSLAAMQIDSSFRRFMEQNNLHADKVEDSLVLCGGDVIDNGLDKAIINERVLTDNNDRLPNWAVMIKLLSAFKKVAMVSMPNMTDHQGNHSMRLDDMVSFVDEGIIVMADMEKEKRDDMHKELRKKFRNDVSVIDMPKTQAKDGSHPAGICGMYSSLLATESFVYVPVFGNDPNNWQMGHSSMTDKMAIQMIEVNTHKVVVPVNMPRVICEMGASLKTLAWKVEGKLAEQLKQLAKWQGRRRFFRQ